MQDHLKQNVTAQAGRTASRLRAAASAISLPTLLLLACLLWSVFPGGLVALLVCTLIPWISAAQLYAAEAPQGPSPDSVLADWPLPALGIFAGLCTLAMASAALPPSLPVQQLAIAMAAMALLRANHALIQLVAPRLPSALHLSLHHAAWLCPAAVLLIAAAPSITTSSSSPLMLACVLALYVPGVLAHALLAAMLLERPEQAA